MKCKKCGERAVIKMPQHHLALCRQDYIDWFIAQTARSIKKYQLARPGDRILVAVSGGKDSLSLWDVLWRLGYAADGMYIHLGIAGDGDYSTQSQRYAEDFAAKRGLSLQVVNVTERYGQSIPDLAGQSARGRYKPCSICGQTKRHIMNEAAIRGRYDVLMTAHNLDDEAAVLYLNTMNWAVPMLARQAPRLEAHDGLPQKAKPFCRFYERESAAYALLQGIEYIEEECPFAEGSTLLYYKTVLNRMEAERPGVKMQFYVQFLQARAALFPGPVQEADRAGLHPCPNCGQPTSSAGVCGFCKLMGSET
ncbi:MAG TPA: ATP-binding protein [Anaerolineaceae bacterium]|nr:ATP-binding protein [Anaerolineaceae bacterium]